MQAATAIAFLLLGAGAAAQEIKSFKFEIETLGGQKLDHDQFQNNLVIVDFWGTWCGPCRKAIPGLVELYKKYKHHGLEIIGLCYREQGTKEQVLARVRDFASRQGITYPLALGTPEIQRQVIGFSGYPTMLFFNRGMKLDHVEVGFDPSHVEAMETWVRKQLGLSGGAAAAAANPAKSEKPVAEKKAPDTKKPSEKVDVPAGLIYQPGNHDTGFEFAVEGLDGNKVEFSSFRGKKVVLALTSTWDREAANTAALLQNLQESWGKKDVVVVAASLEQKRERKDKVEAIQAFVAEQKVTYTILPVGIEFIKKVYQPSGVPLFLVFDEQGKLVLRQRSSTKKKVLAAIEGVLKAKG
ncbi:MAG: TlpA family protein disulfide reductase [Planctomycetes bacterium]|nr:TlpA family protein disulfide reductase [Planctomycetota bacterium]MCB9870574.1 TlpA family protein disulfide reductase [Planctomycetota bacterium]